jgi:hypothetical protein
MKSGIAFHQADAANPGRMEGVLIVTGSGKIAIRA